MRCLPMFLLLMMGLHASDSPRTSVVRTDHGFIDYANRLIVSRGTASVIAKTTSQADLKVVENTAINDTEVDLDSEKIEDTLTLLNKYIQESYDQNANSNPISSDEEEVIEAFITVEEDK